MAISMIGIKKLYYGTAFAAAPAAPYVEGTASSGFTAAEIKAKIALGTEITNIHGDLWTYEEAMNTVTGYKNKLTDEEYRATYAKGEKKMSFTIGQYEFATKAALQGGTASTTVKYVGPATASPVYKSMIALTDDDIYIVFPKARVNVGGVTTDDAVGLKCEAVQMQGDVAGMDPFLYITKAAVDAAS